MDDPAGSQPAVVAIDAVSGDVEVISGEEDSPAGALVVLRRGGRTVDVRHEGPGWDNALVAAQAPRETEALPVTASRKTTTVAICTLGVHPRLLTAVTSVLDQTHLPSEVLVIDNDPASGATRRALAAVQGQISIVDEPRRGLSHARNAALAAASSEVVAFTDDDAVMDRWWLQHLVAPFEDHAEVGAVTGLVLPAELRTPAQRTFETYVGFSKGTELLHWTLDEDDSAHLPGRGGPRGVLFPWTTGKVGSGNNMAFRTEMLREIGGFDTHLGAGSRTQGGEDLDAFTRTLIAGHAIIYTPDALVWHYHRETMPELRKQIRANGVGMGALVAKAIAADPRNLGTFGLKAMAVGRSALASRGNQRTTTQSQGRVAADWALVAQELIGLAQGPWRYLWSGRRKV